MAPIVTEGAALLIELVLRAVLRLIPIAAAFSSSNSWLFVSCNYALTHHFLRKNSLVKKLKCVWSKWENSNGKFETSSKQLSHWRSNSIASSIWWTGSDWFVTLIGSAAGCKEAVCGSVWRQTGMDNLMEKSRVKSKQQQPESKRTYLSSLEDQCSMPARATHAEPDQEADLQHCRERKPQGKRPEVWGMLITGLPRF